MGDGTFPEEKLKERKKAKDSSLLTGNTRAMARVKVRAWARIRARPLDQTMARPRPQNRSR